MADGSGQIEGSIQALVQARIDEALAAVKKDVAEQVERLDKAVEGMSERCTALDAGVQELRAGAEQRSGEASAGAEQLKADLEALGAALRLRLDRHESDEEGGGGLEQLREGTERLKQELSALDGRLQAQAKSTNGLRSKLDALEEAQGGLRSQCDTTRDALQKSSGMLEVLESSRSSIEERYSAFEDRLGQKHEELWQDVHRAVEEVRKDSAEAMEQDMARRRIEMKKQGRSHVEYVTNLLASSHSERKGMEMCKGLLQVWKEQTWADARRKTGLRLLATALGRVGVRRERSALQRWSRAASIQCLSDRLREEYEAKLTDMKGVVGERCGGLEGDIKGLRGDIDGLHGELEQKCSIVQLEGVVGDHSAKLASHAGEVEQVKARIDEHKEALEHANRKHDGHRESFEAHRSDLEALRAEHGSRLAAVDERFSLVDAAVVERLEEHGKSQSEEAQSMMRDVLVMWNSLKQLDSAKADKAALDAFALEMTSSYKFSAKKSEDLQAEVNAKVQEETTRLKEDVDSKVTHWEQMWGKLAGLVEDLIAKVGQLQATRPDAGPMRDGGGGAASRAGSPSRTAAGRLSREGSATSLHGDSATIRPSSLPVAQPGGYPRTASTPMLRSAAAAGSPAAAVAALHASGSGGGASGEAAAAASPSPAARSLTPDGEGRGGVGGFNGVGPSPLPPFRARPPSRPGSASARVRTLQVGPPTAPSRR